MTSRLIIGFCAGCTLLIAGCAPVPLVPDELVIKPQASVEHQADKSIVVPLPKVRKEFRSTWTETPMQELEPQLFQDVLVTTLEGSGLFRQVISSGDADYSLGAEILVQRMIGAGSRIMLLFVRYQLNDNATGSAVWKENLLTYRRLTMAEGGIGMDLIRQLTQDTVQGGMEDLVIRLDEVMRHEG